MKNMLIAEYLLNILHLVNMKLGGKAIASSACVLRLAELRCVRIILNTHTHTLVFILFIHRLAYEQTNKQVIEKTKSIELKLKYQIDKLLKLAVGTASAGDDPLSFKANAANFAKANENSDGEGAGDDDDIISKGNENDEFDDRLSKSAADKKRELTGKYVPPRINPVYNS